MKEQFKFSVDGLSYEEKDIPHFEDRPELHAKIKDAQDKFYTRLAPAERLWRNQELTATDWMMVPDATLDGQPLADSDKLDQIKAYRMKLRSYNLMDEPRPTRPEWFK